MMKILRGRRRICVSLVWFLWVGGAWGQLVEKDDDFDDDEHVGLSQLMFPSLPEEYDLTVFDPHTMFGSPYGGFARATRSRLASLPMRLLGLDDLFSHLSDPPSTTESEEKDVDSNDNDNGNSNSNSNRSISDDRYFRLHDGEGRPFVCRIYHEDELEPSSLGDSMFDRPQLIGTGPTKDTTDEIEEEEEMERAKAAIHAVDPRLDEILNNVIKYKKQSKQEQELKTTDSETTMKTNKVNDQEASPAISEDQDKTVGAESASTDMKHTMQHDKKHGMVHIKASDVKAQLNKMKGTCSQIHLGWWSFEWCHEKHVLQFHLVSTETKKNQKDAKSQSNQITLEVESILGLGTFKERHVKVDDGHGHRYYNLDEAEEDISGQLVVIDTFEGGNFCDTTGEPRKAEVEIRCCKGEENNVALAGSGATIKSVKEEDTCEYRVHVCSPLLCADAFLDTGKGSKDTTNKPVAIEEKLNKQVKPSVPKRVNKPRKENESIRETLDRTLQGDCMYLLAGWWTYEFCHGIHVRQYHLNTLVDPATGMTVQSIETEHLLGLYNTSVKEYPNEEEHNHVVNATETTGNVSAGNTKLVKKKKNSGTTASPTLVHGGNGAVYVQDYTFGDTCDQSDVTDSSIKGGNVVDGGIERTTSVRFGCGNEYALMNINEDSTCHYQLEISVPDLCDNLLFKAPVIKTQVIKCLPE